MKIIEMQHRTPQQIAQLVEVWESSVQATHHFLSDAEVEQIKQYVPQALTEVAHLFVAQRKFTSILRLPIASLFAASKKVHSPEFSAQ